MRYVVAFIVSVIIASFCANIFGNPYNTKAGRKKETVYFVVYLVITVSYLFYIISLMP